MGDGVTRYAAGARYERKAKEELEEDGWLVVRSAGSKGPFDLIAVKTRLIQVKKTRRPRAWTSELEEMGEQVCGAGITRELWVWNEGDGWERYEAEDEW